MSLSEWVWPEGVSPPDSDVGQGGFTHHNTVDVWKRMHPRVICTCDCLYSVEDKRRNTAECPEWRHGAIKFNVKQGYQPVLCL